MYLLDTKQINDGELINAPKGCFKQSPSCKSFYEDIMESEGFHKCPRGMSSYVKKHNEKFLIFSCFKTDKFSLEREFKNISGHSDGYNPVLKENNILSLIESTIKQIEMEEIQNSIKDFFVTLKHETIYWAGEIQSLSDNLSRQAEGKRKEKSISDISKKIYHFSKLIGFNFSRFDMLNDSLTTSSIVDRSYGKVHSRFFAIIRCLEFKAREKGIEINTHGESHQKSLLNFETFDVLPFVIIENAIKYSPNNEDIDVYFEEDFMAKKIIVKIKSYGPPIYEEEYSKIFDKTYRGTAVKSGEIKGSGIGLYLAKRVCEIHSINYDVQSQYYRTVGRDILHKNTFTFEISF